MGSPSPATLCVYAGDALARYAFGHGHPFGPDRFYAFWRRFQELGLERACCIRAPVAAEREAIERFHTREYVAQVIRQSKTGEGFLDYGDTPAFRGVYEAACYVAGSGLDAARRILHGECRRAFVPIGGLHHARRDRAAGFCVFNDCALVIEALRAEHRVCRVAYVDIDAHHGDGVFYAFESDPDLHIADMHEDGRFLYPGSGARTETGKGAARGTKLNLPLPPGADEKLFFRLWHQIEEFVARCKPEFILFQCGADSLAGDPITHLRLTPQCHQHAARALCRIAEEHCQGRILAFGGGGYNRGNLAEAWTAVAAVLADQEAAGS